MCICNRGESSVLVSASGDGETKLWEITRAAGGDEELCLSPLKTLTGEEDSAVLSTIACENTVSMLVHVRLGFNSVSLAADLRGLSRWHGQNMGSRHLSMYTHYQSPYCRPTSPVVGCG